MAIKNVQYLLNSVQNYSLFKSALSRTIELMKSRIFHNIAFNIISIRYNLIPTIDCSLRYHVSLMSDETPFISYSKRSS